MTNNEKDNKLQKNEVVSQKKAKQDFNKPQADAKGAAPDTKHRKDDDRDRQKAGVANPNQERPQHNAGKQDQDRQDQIMGKSNDKANDARSKAGEQGKPGSGKNQPQQPSRRDDQQKMK